MRSREQAVAHDAPDGPEAVLPADLLALGVGAAVVADAHLIDTRILHPGQFRGHLRLEAEASLLQHKPLGDVAADEQ